MQGNSLLESFEGVDLSDITDRIVRPLFVEVPIGHFAGTTGTKGGDDNA